MKLRHRLRRLNMIWIEIGLAVLLAALAASQLLAVTLDPAALAIGEAVQRP